MTSLYILFDKLNYIKKDNTIGYMLYLFYTYDSNIKM